MHCIQLHKKGFISLILTLFWVVIVIPEFSSAQPKEIRRITIATAGTAGALYPMGVALGQTITKHAPGYAATAEASGGSLDNLKNLAAGNVEWGISANEVAYFAYHGLDIYKEKPIKSLRALFGTLVSWVQIFTKEGSPVKGIPDFKGRKIGVGPAGSAGERTAQKILAFYGLDYKSVKPVLISDMEMVTALKDGTIDAFVSTHPLKSAAMLDLTTTTKVRMIPIDDPEFYKTYPYFTKRIIQKGTYKGVDYDVATPTSRIVMYTSTKAQLSEDDIYRILKTIWEHQDEWVNVHAAVKAYTRLDIALEGIRIPLHPGAFKFYREKGFNIPNEIVPK
jgi:TRAP transporter TAXI family solute receptor